VPSSKPANGRESHLIAAACICENALSLAEAACIREGSFQRIAMSYWNSRSGKISSRTAIDRDERGTLRLPSHGKRKSLLAQASRFVRNQLSVYFLRPLLRCIRAVLSIVTWRGVCTALQVAIALLVLTALLLEGVLSAIHHEGVIRDSAAIEFPLQGLQTTATAEDLAAVKKRDNLSGALSLRTVRVDGVKLHAVGAVLLDVLRTHHVVSMIDWPCREHRDIVPSTLYLAMNVTSTEELAEPSFRYYCMDSDSGELSQSSWAVRDAVGRRRGLNYILQRSPGSFRISKTASAVQSKPAMPGADAATGVSENFVGRAWQNDRLVGLQELSRTRSTSTDARATTLLKTNYATNPYAAELVFSWGGRTGGRNCTTEVRELVLSAAASGARLALIGAHAAFGTRWERPNETMGAVNDLTTGRFLGNKMPWFPFGNAVVSVSDAYSPAHEDNMADPRFLVLYRLDAIPELLVKKRRAESRLDGVESRMPPRLAAGKAGKKSLP
jgi:hypothetical protein